MAFFSYRKIRGSFLSSNVKYLLIWCPDCVEEFDHIPLFWVDLHSASFVDGHLVIAKKLVIVVQRYSRAIIALCHRETMPN
jgi:hypothetical protein